MKKQNLNMLKKSLAVFLSACTFLLFILGFILIIYMAENDYYESTRGQIAYEVLVDKLGDEVYEVEKRFWRNLDLEKYYEGTNFRFTIEHADGRTMLSTYDGEAVREEYSILFRGYGTLNIEDENYDLKEGFTVYAYIIEDDAGLYTDLFEAPVMRAELLWDMRWGVIALDFVAAALLILLLLYIFCTVGHHVGEERARGSFLEKIPFDIFTVIYALLATVAISLIVEIISFADSVLYYLLFGLLLTGAYLLGLLFFVSLAVRIKIGGLWRTTLVWRVCAWVCRVTKAFFRRVPLIWKTLISFGVLTFLDLLMTFGWRRYGEMLAFYWICKVALVFVGVIFIVVMLRELEAGGKKIADGHTEHRIDTTHLVGSFKAFGETLNHIGDGISREVDERMKSERMKTELITNVSHDIKTPLTSIINYVDLIEKEPVENENVREYVAILERQSARLKKLIEDLVEASKASSGALQVEMSRLDVGVLLQQTVGEYDEKLAAAGLTPVVSLPEETVTIMADGRHLWRVFDNLMNNICKYSLPGTRIYLDLTVAGGKALVSFKNISRSPLNISSDELMERFVRGDSSRHTEGSGLGLSIAKSLAELQGGTLSLSVDGDLFKATLAFDLVA